MKRILITFLTVFILIAVLQLSPAFGALDHVSSDNSSENTHVVLKNQRLNCLADLPSEIQRKIVQRMQRADYDIHKQLKKLPSGQDSLYSASNRNQNINSFFTHDGVYLLSDRKDDPEWHLEMKLSAYGYEGTMKKISHVKPVDIHASGHRIEYRRKMLTEWYVNNENGLEQGIILNQPPVAQHKTSDSLIVEWEVKSSLFPMLEQTEESITFCESKDKNVLHYSGLKAWDADGRRLSTKLALQKPRGKDGVSRIAFLVDDRNASYPVTIDPVFTQIKKLVRIEHCWSGEFGASVAINGDTIVVGGIVYYKNESGPSCGAAYIFYRNWGGTDNWGLVKKIVPSDGVAQDDFGYSVSISGDTIVVGAPGYWSFPGKAYIFERHHGGSDNWGLVKKIVPSDGGPQDNFGYSVSISGDTVVVSSYDSSIVYIFYRDEGGTDNWGLSKGIAIATSSYGYSVSIDGDTLVIGSKSDNENGSDSGAAHVFYRDEGGTDNWGEAKKIIASDGVADDLFGSCVSINGDTIVVGASRKDSWTGAAYVFERDLGGTDNWGEAKKIIASDGVADDLFGSCVSINGDTIVVGASRKDSWTGAAYVFERDLGGTDNWGEAKKITAGDGDGGDSFGNSLCISGDIVVVGAHNDDFIGWHNGSAYIFDRNYNMPNNWGQAKKLLPVDINYLAGDRFGNSVSFDFPAYPLALVVGAPYDDFNGSNAGAVYAFEQDHGGNDNWGQYRKIFAISDGTGGDYFGRSVSISDGKLVVGAPGDDDHGSNSGSIYILDRNKLASDGWGYDLVKKITPSDGSASDYFGSSVAIWMDTVVVGAYGDDDLGSASGSAYIFQRDEGGPDNWGQVKKLTAFDGAAGDEFGCSVSISSWDTISGTIVVGACKDDVFGTNSGSVYIFDRNTNGFNQWGLEEKIFTSDIGAYDYFGYSVSVSLSNAPGKNVLVGAYGDDDKGSGSGAAYLFSRDEGGADNWSQVKKILASDGAAGDAFGHAVDIIGNWAVVGAPYDDDNGPNSGSAYTFDQYEGGADNWGEINKITASDGAANDQFGDAVSIFLDIAVVGAYQHDEYGIDSGAAYIFSAALPSQPDLVALSVDAEPANPKPGEQVNISVTVKNQGTGDAGPFTVDWYADLTSPPSVSQPGDSFEDASSLAADATCVMSTTYTYSSAGNYSMFAQVDTQDQVEESEENNNVLGPVSIVVGACEGDFDHDGDVDGSDLAKFAGGVTGDVALEDFAADLGRTDCLN